jgi:type I restriction enzyme R subunit
MQENIDSLRKIHEAIKELNRRNDLLKDKYNGDPKYARIQKRLVEAGRPSQIKSAIIAALQKIKEQTDISVLQRNDILTNEGFFTKHIAKLVNKEFEETLKQPLDYDTIIFISDIIVKEYLDEHLDRSA